MQQTRQGIRSTKVKASKSYADVVKAKQTNTAPSPAPTREALQVDKPSGEVHIHIEPLEKMFTDQTGKFPARAASGNLYLMITYHVDANTISVECLKNRTDTELVNGYQKLMSRYTASGIKVSMHVLDNETSPKFKEAIEKNEVTYQLVPPHIHRSNAAERAIRMFK